MSHLLQPSIELAYLRQSSGSGEVSGVNKDVSIRNRILHVRGERVSVRHADKPELKKQDCPGLCCVNCWIPCPLQVESQDDWLGVSSHEQSSSIASSSLLVWNSTHEESAPLLYSCVQLWLAALLLDWVFRREDCWLNSQRHHLDVLNKVDCVTSPWQCVNLGRRFQYRYWLVIDIRNKQKERRNWSRWQCQTPISWSILSWWWWWPRKIHFEIWMLIVSNSAYKWLTVAPPCVPHSVLSSYSTFTVSGHWWNVLLSLDL